MAMIQNSGQLQLLKNTELDVSLADELRVPKREVMADVTFLYAGERPQSCLFFLSYYSPRLNGEESLSEYLNSMNSFFPLRDKASGEFLIVHADQILTVREAPLVEMSGSRPFRLVLQNGVELKLRTSGPRHTWRSRPIDLLNGGERFVAFIQDDHSRIHVNKRHIARVEGL
ncbi:MAG: hypothetical protein PHX05_01560 [Acidobacteriota bacterium]|jgi:hypothetical protein|nr:hypothetical protein [Acidobacteriota bacterium]